LSSQILALNFAVGLTLGTFPVLGVTTALCTLTALVHKLNPAVIQFANDLVYPLQRLVLVPYYQLGDRIFNTQQAINFKTLRLMLS